MSYLISKLLQTTVKILDQERHCAFLSHIHCSP